MCNGGSAELAVEVIRRVRGLGIAINSILGWALIFAVVFRGPECMDVGQYCSPPSSIPASCFLKVFRKEATARGLCRQVSGDVAFWAANKYGGNAGKHWYVELGECPVECEDGCRSD